MLSGLVLRIVSLILASFLLRSSYILPSRNASNWDTYIVLFLFFRSKQPQLRLDYKLCAKERQYLISSTSYPQFFNILSTFNIDIHLYVKRGLLPVLPVVNEALQCFQAYCLAA